MEKKNATFGGRGWRRLHLPVLVLWAGAMLWLSLDPSPPAPPQILVWDKLQHALAYGVLTLLCAPALHHVGLSRRVSWGAALVIAVLFGGALELAQGWLTATRQAEWGDLLADFVGSFLALCGACLIVNFRGLRRGKINSVSRDGL